MRQRIAEADELLQKPLALLGVEFEGIRGGHRLGAAVFACEAASLGHLPVDEHWILRKVMSHAAHVRSSACDDHCFPLPATAKRTPTSKVRLVSECAKGWNQGSGARGQ